MTCRFPSYGDVASPYPPTGYTFPANLANAAAVAAAAASVSQAQQVAASGTSSVTTGSCTTEWPDYSGVDSTTSTFESRPDLSLNETTAPVSISSGKNFPFLECSGTFWNIG